MEARCKICTSPHRLALEKLFVAQAKHQDDENGERVTFPYIVKYAAEKFGMYLTDDNMDNHLAKHFQLKDALKKAADVVNRQSTNLLQSVCLEEIFDRLDTASVRKEIIARGLQQIREVDGASITPDHVLKALEQEAREKVVNPLEALMDAAANAVNFTVEQARAAKAGDEVLVIVDIEEAEVVAAE